MKWYCSYTDDAYQTHIVGPYSSQEDATIEDSHYGSPFQEADGYLDTLPTPIMRVSLGGQERTVWSDGTQTEM